MKRMNLFAVATLVLGLFACDRNADRASQTNTTSASQPADNPGGITPAPTAPVDTSTGVSSDLTDAGHAGMMTTTGSDTDTSAKDAGHRAGTTNLDKNGKPIAPAHRR